MTGTYPQDTYRLTQSQNGLGWKGSCPGFSWGRVNFLSGSWCSTVFWIWVENEVDDILTFSVVARQSRSFQLLGLAWPARCLGSCEGTQPGQLTQSGHRGILFHMASCSLYKLGGVGRGAATAARGRVVMWLSSGGEQLHLCITCFVHIIIAIIIIINYYYYCLLLCFPIKLSSSQPMSFYFSPFSSPSHGRVCVCVRERAAAWCLAASWG